MKNQGGSVFLMVLFGVCVFMGIGGLIFTWLGVKASKDAQVEFNILNSKVFKIEERLREINTENIGENLAAQAKVDATLTKSLTQAHDDIDALEKALGTLEKANNDLVASMELQKTWQRELYDKVNFRIDQIPRKIAFETKRPLPIEIKNLDLEIGQNVFKTKEGKVKYRGIIRTHKPRDKRFNMPKVNEKMPGAQGAKTAMKEAGL